MADMGNEPDEVQQMMHLLMHANKVDIEGLIVCSGKYLHADRGDGRTKTHPELFHKLVDAYAAVVENLQKHEEGWPTANYLRSVIKSGSAGYGHRRCPSRTFERGIKATTIRSLRSVVIPAITSFSSRPPPAKPLSWTHPLHQIRMGTTSTLRGGSITRQEPTEAILPSAMG